MGDARALLLLDFPRGALRRRVAGNKALSDALSAITAAVVGVVVNLALWFSTHVLFTQVRTIGLGTNVPVLASLDWRAALLAIGAVIAMLWFRVG